jgi:protein-S-isoprenylcysteine O-methyltransferase Ste14
MRSRDVLVLVTDVGIAVFLCLFVWVSVESFRSFGNYADILTALNESVYVALYLVRSRAIATSASPEDWIVALSGTFLPVLLRPAPVASPFFGDTLVIIGTILNIAATINLGKSIGIVPAIRQIKTTGLYKVIRHPMYASGILVSIGYFLVNASLTNAALTAAVVALLCVRVEREEKFLARDPMYQEYQKRTSWKLFPLVY